MNKFSSLRHFSSSLFFLRITQGLISLVMALSSFDVRSQTAIDLSTTQIWINPGLYSYHFDRNKDFRERNSGLGGEIWLSKNYGLMFGTFINSDNSRSRYGAIQWRPFNWQTAGVNLGLGIALGGFDGYPRYRNGKWFPAAIPAVSIEYKRLGMNAFIVPTIENRLEGAIAIQFKWLIWP